MQIGDTVTWMEHVRATGSEKRVRFITGVIVKQRTGSKGREFRVAVEFISGNLPEKVELMIWVSEMAILQGRASSTQHVSKVTPLALIMRRCSAARTAAVRAERANTERLRLALNRAGIRL